METLDRPAAEIARQFERPLWGKLPFRSHQSKAAKCPKQTYDAAEFARDHMKKSVLAYIVSLTALRSRTMGHAGAIATTAGESAEEKVDILSEVEVGIIMRPFEFRNAVEEVLARL